MGIKRILSSIVALILTLNLNAGHEVGGMIITYKSLAANGNPLEYELTVYAMYAIGAITPPTSISMSASSGCYPIQSTNLSAVNNPSGGGAMVPVTGVDYCTMANPSSPTVGLVTYKGTIVLPGTCADFRFNIVSGYNRYGFTDNISSTFNSDYFYAKLDNTFGPQSSPEPDISQLIQSACVNKPLSLYSYSEADGDSLHFIASAPTYISGSTISNHSFNSGYSMSNPVGSSVGYSVNPFTGIVQTQLTSAGTFAIPVKYREYSHSGGSPVFVGESRFVFILIASTNCYTPAFNLTPPPYAAPDSLQCGDNIIYCAASRKIAPGTITSSGSEFTVSSSVAGSYPVTAASVVNDSIIKLELGQQVMGNDIIDVFASNGNDNDVVYSHCGQELTAYEDTVRYYSNATPAPVAAFTWNRTLLTINFTNSSTGGMSVLWDFGDGSPVSNNQNPSHTYAAAGTYNVSLIVENSCGQIDTLVQTITVCDGVSAHFSHSISGDTVYFDARNSSGGSQYLWQFGDGNNGTGDSTMHVYNTSGQYYVILILLNDCGDTAIFADSVKLCQKPIASWTYTIVSSSSTGMTIDFDGTASINASVFEWDFGDGSTNNTTATPRHTYTTPSLSYLVKLKVMNSCSDSHTHAYRLDQIGEEEFALEKFWSIYPNPANETVKIEWSDSETHIPSEIILMDYSGKQVIHYTLTESEKRSKLVELNISSLSDGLYFLSINNGTDVIRSPLRIGM